MMLRIDIDRSSYFVASPASVGIDAAVAAMLIAGSASPIVVEESDAIMRCAANRLHAAAPRNDYRRC